MKSLLTCILARVGAKTTWRCHSGQLAQVDAGLQHLRRAEDPHLGARAEEEGAGGLGEHGHEAGQEAARGAWPSQLGDRAAQAYRHQECLDLLLLVRDVARSRVAGESVMEELYPMKRS